MKKIFRFLRYNQITKSLMRVKFIDYLLRRFLIRPFYDNKHYTETSNNAIEINNELNPILKKYKGFLGHGLALSIIRDGKLPTYQDLDYDIYDYEKIDELKNDMNKLGYVLHTEGFYNNETKQLTFHKNNMYIVDFFVCKVNNNSFDIGTVCCEVINPKFTKICDNKYVSNKYTCYLRKMTYTDIIEVKIDNNIFYLPKNHNLYFKEMYGNDWNIQKKYFNWMLYPKNNMPKKIKKCRAVINEKQFNFFN